MLSTLLTHQIIALISTTFAMVLGTEEVKNENDHEAKLEYCHTDVSSATVGPDINANDTLKSVVMILRHGDRNPIGVGNSNKHWIGSLGQLSNAGKQRMYELGRYTRLRYKNFLSDNPDECYARSAEVDRCISSASLVLTGMYPPNGAYVWNTCLNWQPVPIRTVPRELDFVLKPSDSQKAIREELEKLNEPRVILDKMRSVLELAKRDLGLDYTNFEQVQWLYNDLKCQYEQHKELPDWYDEDVRETLHEAAVQTQLAFTSTSKLRALRSGPMLKEILFRLTHDNILDSEGVTHIKKISLFCTHDTEIAALLNTLSVWNKQMPGYGATIYFERHNDKDYGEIVKMFYLNGPNEVQELKPYGIYNCDLDTFMEIVNNVERHGTLSKCDTK
ncbi:Testicular acid phosphatase-like protein [Fragariocoptes setiger]|uniref:Testicular acid phosphatase-like protein n=1 Tax=Fragariocoptes setiger TaxID=1670756 RepID=A0ABQ7S8Y6_9ACAR|nr:Testicular acid phosphatase-like protein [Fragariocoptes setiger]